jgi:hypothetical protein
MEQELRNSWFMALSVPIFFGFVQAKADEDPRAVEGLPLSIYRSDVQKITFFSWGPSAIS